MCGRMTLTTDDYDSVARELDAVVSRELRELYRPRYNVAPGDVHWIVCRADEQRILRGATWGWFRDDGGLLVNARAENVARSPTHRVAFLRGRCGVVADGFFEWSGPRSDRRPWWFHRPDGGLLVLAGLFDDVVDPATGESTRRFTVLTTEANREVSDVHDRMPVILPLPGLRDWLSSDDEQRLGQLLRPSPDATLVARPVSKLVNKTGNDAPECIEPVPAPPRQGSLFDKV